MDLHPENTPAMKLCARDQAPGSSTVFLRPWLVWTAGFLSFPLAGLAGTAVAGRVDSPGAALVGGLITGAVIGAAQGLTSSRRLPLLRWTVTTATGMGLGLLLGASAVGYGTSLGDLAVMGVVTGLLLGAAQAAVLPTDQRRRAVWVIAMALLWALGWTVTTVAGIDVERAFTVFGATGAVIFSALSGALLHRLLPVRRTSADGSGTTPVKEHR